jgi:hypothetical protein
VTIVCTHEKSAELAVEETGQRTQREPENRVGN